MLVFKKFGMVTAILLSFASCHDLPEAPGVLANDINSLEIASTYPAISDTKAIECGQEMVLYVRNFNPLGLPRYVTFDFWGAGGLSKRVDSGSG